MSKDKLIKAQKEYIELLVACLSTHSRYMRPYKEDDNYKDTYTGHELRAKIKKYSVES